MEPQFSSSRPLARPSAPLPLAWAPPLEEGSEAGTMPEVRLWILEDDSELCELLIRRCARQGWHLRAFHHPRAMEQALGESEPDLLMLDQLLPLKCGTDVLTGLRRNGHGFPVLMLSALHGPSDRIAGLEAGADDYLGKPFVFRELQLRLSRLLATRQAARASAPPANPQAEAPYRLGPWHFDPQERQLTPPDGEPLSLSRGDSALLLALCSEPGAVISRQRLAQATGSLVDPEQSRSIDMRLSRLRRLLNQESGGIDSLECLRGIGYRLTLAVQCGAVPSP